MPMYNLQGGGEREKRRGKGWGKRLYKETFRYHHMTGQVLPFVTRAQVIPECTDRCAPYSKQNVLPFS